MILHESLTTSSPSTNQPNCHIQNRKKVLQKKSWNNPEEKLTIYQNHSTLVWSEHRSALGNIFSDPNFQPFFSRDIFLCVWRYSKSCDAEFFGESLENQKLVPLSAICSGCHNGFVRLWILYLSAVKVCIFGSKFLPSCGSGTSLSLVPPIRDLYRGGSTMGGRQMAPGRTVKQRKALSLGALPGLPNKGQERQNHPHHNHHKCTVPPQKRLIATLKIETKKFLPPLCSPPSPSPAKHAFPLTFLFSPGFILSLRLRKRIYSSSPPNTPPTATQTHKFKT